MQAVSIARCSSYDEKELDRSTEELLSHIGGIQKYVKSGQKVLLKINALMESDPEKAIITHPELTRAVAKLVIRAGGTPVIGDNPGSAVSDPVNVIRRSGYGKIADELGIEIISLQAKGARTFPAGERGRRTEIVISSGILDADVVINLPKLKTHMLMLYTGAVKNMFGAVPGFNKSKLHFLKPSPDDLAGTIADIYGITKPALNIMDAVVSMEGNGPSGGTPKKTGLLLASSDGVALDAVASKMIGFKPEDVPTTAAAGRRGMGEASLERIEVKGVKLRDIGNLGFKKPSSQGLLLKLIPGPVYSAAKPLLNMVKILPIIDAEKCRACGICAESCPAKCISMIKGKTYRIDQKRCIMCFCCHELCPYKAIELKRSFLAGVIFR